MSANEREGDTAQLPIDAEMAARPWDVAIIGAGPAGSIAAHQLAARGYRVLMLDRAGFPRDKSCGGGLIADSIECLRRVGAYDKVAASAYRATMGKVYSPSRLELAVPGEYLVLRRDRLDLILARYAVAAGAVFARGTVTDVRTDGDGLVSCLVREYPERPLTARVVLIATGARVVLLQRLGMVIRRQPSAIATRCYVRSEADLKELIISYDREIIPGYAWIFPLGCGEYNVGCGVFFNGTKPPGVNLRTMLDRFASRFPAAVRLFERGEKISRNLSSPLRCSLAGARMQQGPVLAIGETIGATFPFTGEGIGKAMESAEIAATIVHEFLESGDADRLRAYPAEVERRLGPRYKGYRIAQRWLSRAWLNDFVARRAQKSEFLRTALAGILTEQVDPDVVFSVRGIVRSFWS